MKLAIIGCGTIARQHAVPMQKAGFEIVAISGRNGISESLNLFSSDFNISNKFDNSIDLLKSDVWDALLISCPTENMLEYLNASLDINKPILCEKPISYNYKDLVPFIDKKNICVALNRRFYTSTNKARDFIKSNNNIMIKVSIPETLNKPPYSTIKQLKSGKIPIRSYHNSIHMFDILNFIVGKIDWKHIERIYSESSLKAIIAIGTSEEGIIIQLDNYYDSSSNFSIDIISNEKRLLLEPIEVSSLYSGMSVQEASDTIPIRKYIPFLKEKTIENIDLKPGFMEQANSFMNFCMSKDSKIPKVNDLYNSLKLMNDLN